MTTLTACIEGIGFWSNGLPSWRDACDFVRNGTRPDTAPARPSPQLLPPNERRRAPETVAVALDVAQAACADAQRDPAQLPSVFASTHGDLAITDYMCATLAQDAGALSPIRFHNSVHNAAAGYWTIGTGCMQATTAISAFDASFAEGLLEATLQLAAGAEAVLLVGYDAAATGPLRDFWRTEGLLGGALVLGHAPRAGRPQITLRLDTGVPDASDGPLARSAAADNAMAPMLPLFDALALGADSIRLFAGPERVLQVDIDHG